MRAVRFSAGPIGIFALAGVLVACGGSKAVSNHTATTPTTNTRAAEQCIKALESGQTIDDCQAGASTTTPPPRPPEGDAIALRQCETAYAPMATGPQSGNRLVAAFTSSERISVRWIDAAHRVPPGPTDGHPQAIDPTSDAPISACYYEGVFPCSSPQPGPPYTRELGFVKANGTFVLAECGTAENLPVERPVVTP